jgi:hypothetical protein
MAPKKGSCSSLGVAATHLATDTHVKIQVTSTPPSHTINRAELVGTDLGLQIGHTHLLKDRAFSLRLIHGFMRCPSAYRHHDTLESITHILYTRCTSGIRTYLGKIKAHNHSIGNDRAETLVNQAADRHPPDTCTSVSIGHGHGIIEIKIVYNNTNINRLLSLGPPFNASYLWTYKLE